MISFFLELGKKGQFEIDSKLLENYEVNTVKNKAFPDNCCHVLHSSSSPEPLY